MVKARIFWAAGALAIFSIAGAAQLKPFVPDPHTPGLTLSPKIYGPYSGHFLRGGQGLAKPLPEADPLLGPEAAWTLSAWLEIQPGGTATVAISGVGLPTDEDARLFVLDDGLPALRLGQMRVLRSTSPLTEGWHLLAATYANGKVRLFVDGRQAASDTLHAGPVRGALEMAPLEECGQPVCPHFGGRIADLSLSRTELTAGAVEALFQARPDFDLIAFEDGSKPWPIQTVQFAGNVAPQEPSTLPKQKAPFSKLVAVPPTDLHTSLASAGEGDWILQGGWMLAEAPEVHASGEQIASPDFDTHGWMPAVVPGTVLTTMIANGRYPDPDFGLNNLAIPEKLNRQDYWYRVVFQSPALADGRNLRLCLDGINYRAEVWMNGKRLGETVGAFQRGVFDVRAAMRQNGHKDGPNVLAIRVSPAPHPGIPNVQSIAFGAGLNGGAMALDGPTFMATEGWDWFPPMHDRDTGIWQDVHLLATGPVSLGDVQVVTHLPLPDISQAEVSVNVPVINPSSEPVRGTITVSFEGVSVKKEVTVAPGESVVELTPSEFPELHLNHPRLWWPNGYGKPELFHLKAQFAAGGVLSATQTLRFGVREVSYELSLLDNHGDLRRVAYDPTDDRTASQSAVDVTHEAMRQIPGGWAASIAAHADGSEALRPVADTRGTPDLILRVNGVRIAVRGGSWGMEDTRKRISRAHLEPFFRLDRDANVNIIRNWQGQNTEPVFYDLADEYGLMVWNDFWEVTQDSNAEAGDPELFLRNAADTIRRYRSHSSIVMWCGRNEGVPQPAINHGLIALTHTLDGTRYYSPSSNQVNLRPSGPYSYEDPADYYTKLAPGFAVEVGTSSLPTLEWFHRWLPAEDQWPIDDDWGYHNWHPHDKFNAHMEAQFGVADSLEEYVRKAQMMNYVDYRAIFEGFNQHLWAPNGGRLLWMTQPAWPSMLWGILSSDYDTQASFYATRKACEPLHVQMDLSNGDIAVVNTTREPVSKGVVTADVFALNGKLLQHSERTLDAAADDVTIASRLDLPPLMGTGTVLVRLQLHDSKGVLRSRNVYWRAASDAGYRAMIAMPAAAVTAKAHLLPLLGDGSERTVQVDLHNDGLIPSLETKLVLEDAGGQQILPAYYSDNYVSLLPGEEQQITVQVPSAAVHSSMQLRVRGWNEKTETLSF